LKAPRWCFSDQRPICMVAGSAILTSLFFLWSLLIMDGCYSSLEQAFEQIMSMASVIRVYLINLILCGCCWPCTCWPCTQRCGFDPGWTSRWFELGTKIYWSIEWVGKKNLTKYEVWFWPSNSKLEIFDHPTIKTVNIGSFSWWLCWFGGSSSLESGWIWSDQLPHASLRVIWCVGVETWATIGDILLDMYLDSKKPTTCCAELQRTFEKEFALIHQTNTSYLLAFLHG